MSLPPQRKLEDLEGIREQKGREEVQTQKEVEGQKQWKARGAASDCDI